MQRAIDTSTVQPQPATVNLVHLIAFGFDSSLAVLCFVGGIAAIFIGYLVFDGIRRWWRHRHYTRWFRRTKDGRDAER